MMLRTFENNGVLKREEKCIPDANGQGLRLDDGVVAVGVAVFILKRNEAKVDQLAADDRQETSIDLAGFEVTALKN